MKRDVKRLKKIHEFILGKGCTQYNIRAWECPSFLFLVMGIITIFGMIITFIVGQRIATPDAIVPAIFFIALAIFIPGTIIVQSFERMAAANQMKSEFVSIVSHQMRSPLSAIKWTLNTLMTQDLSKGQIGHYTELIQENNERMIKLVNDLLNVSRIERGELKVEKRKINIEEIAKEIIESIEPIAKSKNIKLEREFNAPDGASVVGDEMYIEMVITNFIDNAIRYSEEGSSIVIRLINKDSDIRFEVKDFGRGVPDDEKQFIFDKFFRARNVSKETETGTGLGLFIAKAAIEKMNGKIGFISKENKGSTFWFQMPLENNK